jgi:tetratricopeptide (TPR) repeat protein
LWWNVSTPVYIPKAYLRIENDQRLADIEGHLIDLVKASSILKENFIVPYQRNTEFVGRTSFLDELERTFWNERPQESRRQVILSGLGGMGKTQLALEYAYTYEAKYESVFWVGAASNTTLLSSFQSVALRSGCIGDIEAVDQPRIAKKVLSWLNSRDNWLFVIDNLEDDSVIQDYLPFPNVHKHVLITTRNQHCDIAAVKLQVDILGIDDATELLLKRSQIAETLQVREEASIIVKVLGYLPLAIEQAAAYIRQISKSIFNFLRRYNETRLLFDKRGHKGLRDYKDSVATMLSLSFKQVEERNPDASKLLRLLAFLDPDGILSEFLEAGKAGVDPQLQGLLPDSARFDEALSELERFSLIKRQVDGGGFKITVHRLVQAVVRNEMPPESLADTTTSVIGLCDSAFPHWNTLGAIDNEILFRCRSYQTQVIFPLSVLSLTDSLLLANTLVRFGVFLEAEGKYPEAKEHLTRAVTMYKKERGTEYRDTFRAKAHLARTLERGEPEKALSLLEPILQSSSTMLGEEDLDVLYVMQRLAGAYFGCWDLGQAVPLYERVLDVRIKVQGAHHRDTLVSTGNLAAAYNGQGRHEEAAALFEKVMEETISSIGENQVDSWFPISNLAVVYRNQGKMDEAIELYVRAEKIAATLLGDGHPYTVMTRERLRATRLGLGCDCHFCKCHCHEEPPVLQKDCQEVPIEST